MSSPAPITLPQPVAIGKSLQNIWIAITAIGALFGGMHLAPIVTPKPDPAPIIIQQTPQPQPVVQPPVIIQQTPAPVVQTPVINVVYVTGIPVTDLVDPGRMFTVSPVDISQKLIGVVLPAPTSSGVQGEVGSLSDDKLMCTLQPGERLQVFVYGTGKPVPIFVVCKPLVPTPVDDEPAPVVKPLPVKPETVALVSVDLLVDRPHMDKATSQIIENFAYWDSFRNQGNEWRIYHAGSNPSPEVRVASGMAALSTAGATVPGIIIRNKTTGDILYAGSLPKTQLAVSSLLSKYIGVQWNG